MDAPSAEVVARLVASHREFLRFLEARLPSRAIAEEVLQEAFVRAVDKGRAIREAESAVAWFYRLLRNALVDHHRRRAAEERALDRRRAEPELPSEDELRDTICRCLHELLANLKAEYAEVLRRVDLEGAPISEVAGDLGISSNNAGVRLYRARQALRRELARSCGTCATHGCLDCSCQAA